MRRAWLTGFAKQETASKGTARLIASSLSVDRHTLTTHGGNDLAATWLGEEHTGFGYTDLSPTKSATENRALVIALVQVLARLRASHDQAHLA